MMSDTTTAPDEVSQDEVTEVPAADPAPTPEAEPGDEGGVDEKGEGEE